ncbi:membrane protein [Cryptococcus deuterogattii MMRL2647]|nr:membrane protein [Cryptococcus deuterogattii MMRL2647]
MLLLLLLFLSIAGLCVQATLLQSTFSSCLFAYSPIAASENLLNVTQVFATLVPGNEAAELGLTGDGHDVLRLDLVGITGAELSGYDNSTNKLATLFTDTHAATARVYSSTTWLCNSLFPSILPEPYHPYNTTYCPLPAGDFAINISIPLYRSYALTTLHTRVRIVDTTVEAASLACLNIHVSPYKDSGWYYHLFRYWLVALVAGFWLVSWGARFVTGWIVGSGVAEYGQKELAGVRLMGGGSNNREATMRKWGTMIISGLSGERLSVSGGLLRFVTPGVKDILFHIQFASMLGMVAVNWPQFSYPIFAQGAWANLVWNTTLVQGSDPTSKQVSIYPNNYTVPSQFSIQMTDPQYPLYLDADAFNPVLDLHNSPDGMESFATAVGLRPQDLFGTCLAIFLCITAAVIVLSLLLWFLHGLSEYVLTKKHRQIGPAAKRTTLGSSPRGSLGGKEALDPQASSSEGLGVFPTQSAFFSHKSSSPSPLRRIWLRFRPRGEAGVFHAAALYGNLIRLILVFHLPVTIFSMYHLCLGSRASIVSKVFAALSFAFISVLIPAYILYRVFETPTGKLYDATRTLLSIGPMYNIYVEKKQMFRVFSLSASLITGIVVGAGQKSGIAQTIILIVVELAMLIIPGVWYPWGEGASMGAPNAFLTSLRLVSMVLAMLLSPTISMASTAADWITYAILIVQAIIFVFFLLMLLTKLIEGFIRLFGGVHFDESTHPLDGGIFAAIMDLDCLNPVRGGKAAERRRRKRDSRQLHKNVYAAGTLTTQMMLDRHSQGVLRQTVSEGSTPMLYPVGYQPPLGPPPVDQRSSDDRSDERPSGGDNIMDAWRPISGSGYVPPGAYAPTVTSPTSPPPDSPFNNFQYEPNRGFSVVRGGRSNYENPYDIQNLNARSDTSMSTMAMPVPTIRVSQIGQRPMSPPHSRQKSSSAIIELSTPPTQTVGLPQTTNPPSQSASQSMRPNNEGMRPPVLAIPKRRSLNDLKNENDPSPTSQYSESKRQKKKGRRNTGWFHRNETRAGDSESEESDDEPGPSRRKARKAALSTSGMREPEPFEDISKFEQQSGWKKVLGIGKKGLDDLAAQERDENKARKAALATESGSLFAGVEAPKPSPKKKGFVVTRRSGDRPGPSPISPASPESQTGTSFKVKRMGQPTPTPTRVESPAQPESAQASPVSLVSPALPISGATGSAAGPGKKSFQVIRPAMKSSVASLTESGGSTGFVVNRRSPQSTPLEKTPTPSPPPEQVGYAASLLVPISQQSESAGPAKDPRASSGSQQGYHAL